MNNKTIYVIAAVVVVGAIAAFAFYRSPNPSTSPTSGTYGDTQSGNAKTLKGLLASGAPQKCTFTDNSETVSSSGTMYIAQGKMRGDFTSVVSGQTTQTHMIVSDNTNYVWTDGTTQGFKMPMSQTEGQADAASGGVDINKEINYQCGAWGADASQFTPPSNVTFSELGGN